MADNIDAYYDDEFKHDLILVLTSINDNLARIGDLIQQNAEDECETEVFKQMYRERLNAQKYRSCDEELYFFARYEQCLFFGEPEGRQKQCYSKPS